MRLFVAIDTPQAVKDALIALRDDDISGARWVHPQTFHLTLGFIGNVDDTMYKRFENALKTVKSTPFDITVSGVGRFPPSGKKAPRVLWAGIERSTPLVDLQAQVSQVLEAEGLGKDSHDDYNPHLTLARFKTRRPAADVQAFLERHADFALPPFTVTEFILYQSELTPQGARYTHLEHYALG